MATVQCTFAELRNKGVSVETTPANKPQMGKIQVAGESIAGTLTGPAGPLRNWPFKLKKGEDYLDPTTLEGGRTTNKFNVAKGLWFADDEGWYQFDELQSGEYKIEVVLPNGKLKVVEEEHPDIDSGNRSDTPDPLVLKHEEDPSVEDGEAETAATENFGGSVVGPAGPLKNWPFKLKRDGEAVEPDSLDGGATANVFKGWYWYTDSAGGYLFEKLPSAAYTLEVVLPNGKLEIVEEEEALDSGQRAETPDPLVLKHEEEPSVENDEARETFAGTVAGPAGPLKGWPFIFKRGGEAVDAETLEGGKTQNKFERGRWLTGAKGEFRFENLPQADYTLAVILPGGKLTIIDEEAVATDSGRRAPPPPPLDTTPVEEELEGPEMDGAMGHLSVRLLDASGTVPLANRKVVVELPDGDLELTTDKDGKLFHAKVPLEDHNLKVGDAEVSVPAVSKEGEVQDRNVPGVLFGFARIAVRDGADDPLADVDVELEGPDKKKVTGKTDASGNFFKSDPLPAGKWTVRAMGAKTEVELPTSPSDLVIARMPEEAEEA